MFENFERIKQDPAYAYAAVLYHNFRPERRPPRLTKLCNPVIAVIHIPKCAGSSLRALLTDRARVFAWGEGHRQGWSTPPKVDAKHPDVLWLGHATPEKLLSTKRLPVEIWSQTPALAIVRNPYDRSLSLFSHLRRVGWLSREMQFVDFLRFLQRFPPRPGLNWRGLKIAAPQASWTHSKGRSQVQHLVRFEALQDQLPAALADVGLAGSSQLPYENSSPSRPALHRQEISLIQEIYSRDFLEFGYSLEPPRKLVD